MKRATVLWLLLLALTALTTQIPALAKISLSAGAIMPLVALATLVKGRVVIDHFMALRSVGGLLRWIVPGWLVLVLGLIAYAFNLNPI